MKRLFYFPFLLILYEFVLALTNDMYIPALPSLASVMRVDYKIVQLTVTAWLAGITGIALLLPPLFKRFRTRRVFLSFGVIFTFSTLFCSMAQSIAFLIILRIFQGASVCAIIIGGFSLAHSIYEPHRAERIAMWMAAVSILSPMLGPVFGGLLLIYGSWRLIFAILFVFGILVLIPLWLACPSRLSDLPVYGVRNLKNKKFIAGGFALGSIYAALFTWIAASPFLIIELLNYDPFQFGLGQTFIFGAFFLGFYLSNLLMAKIRGQLIIHLGLIFSFAAVLALLLWNLYGGESLASLLIPMAGIAIGFGTGARDLYRLTLSFSLERKEGDVAALYFLIAGIAAVGTFAITVIQESFLSVIGVITIFVSLACLGVFWLEGMVEQ